MLPAASCAGTGSHRSGAEDHAPCHRVSTEASGWNLRGRVQCLFVSTASCRNRRPASCSWWHGCRSAVPRGSASPLPTAGLHSLLRRLLQPAPACLLSYRLDRVRQCLPCLALGYWPLAFSFCVVVQSCSFNFFVISTAEDGCATQFSQSYFFLPAAAFFAAFNGSSVVEPAKP